MTNYSQSLMNQIGQLRWYFAHASVGINMMSGIADLHANNANFYRIQSLAEDATPPSSTTNGIIYQYMRGNDGWQAKVLEFQTYVSNGWRFPKVNLALNKFCFIDPDANLSYYLTSMTNLEAAFPETLFVYMTMPLTVTNYDTLDTHRLRNLFNNGLRDWVSANGRVLYDVADIEAHDTNGVLCTLVYSNQTYQALYSGYCSDGTGHLNTLGSDLVAKGFYALAGVLMSVDRDGDGVTDGEELIAGTRFLDPLSGAERLILTMAAGGTVMLHWNSSSNRLYTLQRGPSLNAPIDVTTLLLDAPATPPINAYTDSPPTTGSSFYRVSVRQ